MHPTNTVNDIQAEIIRQLFFYDKRRFAALNNKKVSSDQFSYHLRQLLKYGIIQKHPDSTYSLTVSGRTRAVMLYPDKSTFVQQGFLGVRLVVTKIEQGQRSILMQRRTAVPYKNKLATPGDKILFGEDVLYAAARTLKAQTGLEGPSTLKGIHHLKDIYQQDVVQDKYFFVCLVTDFIGVLKERGRSGDNIWLPYADLTVSADLVHGCKELIDIALDNQLQFYERTYTVTNY